MHLRKKGYFNIYMRLCCVCVQKKLAKYNITINIKWEKNTQLITFTSNTDVEKITIWKECLFWRPHVRTCVCSVYIIYCILRKNEDKSNSREMGAINRNGMEWNRALVCFRCTISIRFDFQTFKVTSLFSLFSLHLLLSFSDLLQSETCGCEFLFMVFFCWYITSKSKAVGVSV